MSYERLRKHRLLNKETNSGSSLSDDDDFQEIGIDEVIVPCYKTEELGEFVEISNFEYDDEENFGNSSGLNTPEESLSDDYIPDATDFDTSSLINGHIEQKIKNWVLRSIRTVTQKSIDELLMVLRSEGYISLPKSCKTLLGTSNLSDESTIMKCADGTLGKFKYFGIEYNLSSIIDPNVYNETDMKLLIHVDGMDIFNKSKKGFWSIMGKVFSPNYVTKPFLIALFYGDSKPYSARDFLSELVSEINILIKQGINVNEKHFTVQLLGFCCDMPARAFIKCCKGHTGFYSCERCTVKGETVNHTRIFKEINCEERTVQAFREKKNPQHHLTKEDSPLLDITGFDPIKFVILDEMHMLYIGITKQLIQKLVLKNSETFISLERVLILQKNLLNISKDVPVEFQRKTFDLMDLGNWKATQFRFFLLYAGGVVLKDVLEEDHYKHFLILYASCRILSSVKLAVQKATYVKNILRKFVELMPHFYGPNSQTMNIHNLIHIADDVINIEAPISQYSAFDFENSLGFIKSIVNCPTNPIAQIQRKLHIFHTNINNNIPLVYPLNRNMKYSLGNIQENLESKVLFSYVNISGFQITPSHPDNVCLLKNGNIMIVKEIFSKKHSEYKVYDINLKGKMFNEVGESFNYPLSSKEIGIFTVKNLIKNNIEININMVELKCILTTVRNETYAITLLHK